MTARNADEPTEAVTDYPSLAAALAAFQRSLPDVKKGAAGQVRGRSDYKYADLADVNRIVLPALGRVGLSFSCKPTYNEAGRFVLAYTLRHTSGQEDSGEYPLSDSVSPQEMGSAQSYARRYVIQALTGVAPDEDDDGAAATQAHGRRPAAQRPAQGQQNGHQRDTRPRAEQPTEEPAAPSDADRARDALRAHCESHGYDGKLVAARYAAMHEGRNLKTEDEALRITAFTKLLDGMPEAELKAPATSGAAQ